MHFTLPNYLLESKQNTFFSISYMKFSNFDILIQIYIYELHFWMQRQYVLQWKIFNRELFQEDVVYNHSCVTTASNSQLHICTFYKRTCIWYEECDFVVVKTKKYQNKWISLKWQVCCVAALLVGEVGWAIYSFVYICWSYRMVALILCYNSMVPSTCKDDISASAICHLQRFNLVNSCIVRPTQVTSCCFGDLSCNSSFYFAAS